MTANQTRRLHRCAIYILTAHEHAVMLAHELGASSPFTDEFAKFTSHCRQGEAALARIIHDEQIDPDDHGNGNTQRRPRT